MTLALVKLIVSQSMHKHYSLRAFNLGFVAQGGPRLMPGASTSSKTLMKSKSPFSRPVSLQPLPLVAYLTGAVGSTLLVSAPHAEAAVTSVTFGFGSVLSSSSNFYNNATPTTPNLGTFHAKSSLYFGYGQPYNMVRLGQQPFANQGRFYQQSEGNFYGKATFLANGTVVGGGGNGELGLAYFTATRSNLQINSNQLNKNIGFQTTTGNWGWANVSWDASAKALTFHSAYVESVAGNTITVGDIGAVPEPSRALLALAGLGAAGLRRRRKQAA